MKRESLCTRAVKQPGGSSLVNMEVNPGVPVHEDRGNQPGDISLANMDVNPAVTVHEDRDCQSCEYGSEPKCDCSEEPGLFA